jgi:hypothetical protein
MWWGDCSEFADYAGDHHDFGGGISRAGTDDVRSLAENHLPKNDEGKIKSLLKGVITKYDHGLTWCSSVRLDAAVAFVTLALTVFFVCGDSQKFSPHKTQASCKLRCRPHSPSPYARSPSCSRPQPKLHA